ncbi:MAG TPA: YfhO family protein, partial [Verrucomicrobiae bacterium]|nr:YfhO family protein [Verrucomicrobiae bacterium]
CLLALALGVLALGLSERPRAASIPAGACAALLVAMAFVASPFGAGAAPFPTVLPNAALHAAVEAAAAGGRVYSPRMMRRGQHLLSELRLVPGFESSLRPKRVGRLLDDAGLGEALIGETDWGRVGAHHALVDLIGVSLVVPEGHRALRGFTFDVWLPDEGPAWRNPSALPRAFVVHDARAAATPEEAHAAVTDPAFRPGEEAVVEAPLPALAPPVGKERVALVVDEPERVTVAAEVTAPALLVLTDSFFPGWEARVDGTRTPILRADYAFRGVALGAGEHRVEFRYRPWSFYGGVFLAAGAFVVALGAALRRRA